MTEQGRKMRSPYATSMPDMEIKIKGLEGDLFYYGKGMQAKCIQSSKSFLDYVGRTYGESEKQSIQDNAITITDMVEPKDIETEADFKNMTFKEQKMWEKQADVWFKTTAIVNKNLSKAYSVLWSICHSGLQQKITSDKDFATLKKGDVGGLFRLVQKICNGNSSTDNPFTNIMEANYNFLMIKGDSFPQLSLYHEAFEKKYEVIEKCGGWVTSPKFRDLYMKELESREMQSSNVYRLLEEWKKETLWVSTDKGQTPPRKAELAATAALVDQYKAHVYIKRAGPRYDYYRNNLHNNYNEHIAMYPATVTSAHHIMDHHKTVLRTGDTTRETRGGTYQQEGFPKARVPASVPGSEQDSGVPQGFRFKSGMYCFRCNREGHLTKECWFDTKEDGSPLNTSEYIDKKYAEKEHQRRRFRRGPTTTGEQNFIITDGVPSLEDYIHMNDCETQIEHTKKKSTYDSTSRCVTMDVRGSDHVYNQESRCLNPYDVLFDSCSTCDIFVNELFLRNIRRCDWTLLLRTQTGECQVDMVGDLPGVGTVWFYKTGSANILSAHRMVTRSGWSVQYSTDRFRITGDPEDLSYRCITREGNEVTFVPTRLGLHVMDCAELFRRNNRATVFGNSVIDNAFGRAICLSNDIIEPIDTIAKSKSRFTKRDQLKANMVRRFQHVAGHPSDSTMIYAAATNSVKNSPITRQDIELANDMLGRSRYAVQGKTTRKQPDAVTDRTIEVPPTVMQYYKDVELSVDVMHVNRIPFLITVSKHIHYATVNALDNMKIPTLENSIRNVLKTYTIRGFNVTTIHVDIQFKSIKDRKKLTPTVNVVSRAEHVPDIERLIRVVKERARCYYAMLPYNKLPRMMVIHLMITVVFYVNAFVWKDGVSQFLAPITIVEGIALDFNKHFHVIFGEYVHTYDGTTNDMTKRTVGAIAMGPSGNLQGGIRCYSLLSGKVLNRTLQDITQLKMPEEAIRRLAYRARKHKAMTGLEFADRHNNVDMNTSITGVYEPIQNAVDDEINQRHDIELEDIETELTNDEGINVNEDTEMDVTEQIENNLIEEEEEEEENNDEDTKHEGQNNDDIVIEVAPENRADEVPPPESEGGEEEPANTTRSGRISRPYDFENKFPDIYNDNHMMEAYDDRMKQMTSDEYSLYSFFLQTEQEGDELILLKLTGEVALLLVECDEKKWKKHLRKENGKYTIYVACKKAIYGTMNAALLAYKKLAKLFKRWGLVMNPYDPCVWNGDINGKQFTVVFHVDDLLMSHDSPEVVSEMIAVLDGEYGNRDDLTVTRGPVHEYLGMTMDFTVKGECAFSQYDFIKKLLNDLPESLPISYRNTPAPDYLFKVNSESPKLDSKRFEAYHTITAKTLWASQRSRPDIQLATGFHCTRVRDASEHDWIKLGHLMGYIRKTRFIPLIISMDDDGTVIYIDGAHAVHMDAKGHSGLYVTQGKGAMINVSKKHGVLTTSSTETEIVSTGEQLPKCTWFRYFRMAQGEEGREDVLMQDNKSAIVLQKNYPYSTRKGSKHIHVRYFFAVDKLHNKEIRIEHCPTEEMIADYNSKPLQGKLFYGFRNVIMGIREEDFPLYKDRYRKVLKQYDLYDDSETDLNGL